jgi:CheY-like chemotaxis protein
VKTILLVDDEYSIVEVLAHLLGEEGYTVVTAANGQEALDRVSETTPDLVITDQMMPLMSGVDLFRALMKIPSLRRVPVILITSAPLRAARELRWADLIPKPFDLDELLRAVRRVLRE